MTEEKLKTFKGEQVKFDFYPFAHASYHYSCKGSLYDYQEVLVGRETGTGISTKKHLDFLFDLQEAVVVKESKYVGNVAELDTNLLFEIPWNKVKLIKNFEKL